MSNTDLAVSLLKKYWWLIVAGILLCFIAFRSCKTLPSHKEEKKSSDTRYGQYVTDSGRMVHRIADLSFQKDSLQKELDTTRQQLALVRRDAAKRIADVQLTLTSGAEAARRHDTAAILVNWDTLREQVIAGIPVVAAQDSLCQEAINTCIRQGMVKDSLIVSYHTLWAKADSAYTFQRGAYNSLFADYKKANSGYKFNKTLSRGLAIALLIAGAKIFIFK